jgi:hypothetical protein
VAREKRERRLTSRWASRVLIGGAVGAIVGALLGLVVGMVWDTLPNATVATVIAGAIFGMAVGAIPSGMSALESPDPGNEPSEVENPVMDRPEPTRVQGEDDVVDAEDRESA